MQEPTVSPPLRVFVVEDSRYVRELLSDYLQVPGEVEIIGFADSEGESVARIQAEAVDAAIVDLKLKEGSGFGIIQRLRTARPGPPPTIIVLTNHPFPEIRQRCLDLGADYFFDKSLDYGKLHETLQSLRETHR